jgi:hypothetical protein
MTKYKIRVITNGYLMIDSNNREYYYSSIEDFADTITRDLQQNIGYIGEFRLEYSIERANKESVAEQKDKLIAECKNALLMITNTECILETDTISLIKEIAKDAQDALGKDQK